MQEMSMVFYQLSNRSGMPSACPLSTCGSLQLHLVGFSGQKAHGGQAVSAPRCAAVHRCVLHKGWEGSCTCSYFHQHKPQVLPGAHGSAPALEGSSIVQLSLTEGCALPFSAGWEGSVGTMCSPTVPPCFFLPKQGFAQPNQILFFYSVSQELFSP